MNKSQSGHILYLMVHLPFIWWWKIGITGKTATSRAKQVDKAVLGFPVPVFMVFIPGAYFIEQWLHREFAGSNFVFYRGDGHREWFWFWVAPVAFAVMLAIWGIYIWAAGALLGFNGLQWYWYFLTTIYGWAVSAFEYLTKII